MDTEHKYPDPIIYQQIEAVFMPARSWQDCTQVLTDDEMWDLFGIWCRDHEHLDQVLKDIHFLREFNEHNRKYYWLVKAVV